MKEHINELNYHCSFAYLIRLEKVNHLHNIIMAASLENLDLGLNHEVVLFWGLGFIDNLGSELNS